MSIEEEIYAELVKRFGIDEICLPKYGKNRLTDVTWQQFIATAINGSIEDLYYLCGYKKADGFSEGLKNKYPILLKEKGRRPWYFFLLEIIEHKKCSQCNTIYPYSSYSYTKANKDGLSYICKVCDNSKNATRYINNKESIALRQKDYYLDNKTDFTYREAKRRAAKIQATPNWANQVVIKEIYQTCPEGYHVDHIIPLQNDLVCGLHCEFNLQHLSAHDNLSKGNKYEP